MRRVKKVIKRVLTTLAPKTATAILSARARAHSHRIIREWGVMELNRKLIEQFGSVVQSGPFRGMALTPMAHQEHLGPFLLGTYEAEIHPWIEAVVARGFTQFLDIGAKFGYYAVGIALRLPGVPVVAFDTDWWARAATREMVAANKTPNVRVEGYCSPNWLDRCLLPGSFILSDCEGFEGELFGQASTPALASATLLVEIHDNLVPGVGAAVRERFARTHLASTVGTCERDPSVTNLSFLTPDEAATAVREYRDQQEWVLLTPRNR